MNEKQKSTSGLVMSVAMRIDRADAQDRAPKPLKLLKGSARGCDLETTSALPRRFHR